jgi:acetyltransferase-like isoleucine patch superfamily enzyme
MMRLKKIIHFLLVPMPSFAKVLAYRHLFGYSVGKSVKIGLSVVIAGKCRIDDGVRIGHLNFISHIGTLELGRDVRIGHGNILLGGDRVTLGEGAFIGRFNEINSIINPLNSNPANPVLDVGRNAVITAWHKIDYTDAVSIGDSAIIAGRQSCLWTHNRQQVAPVTVGANCYVGSGVQMVPGSEVGAHCVVGLGSVITKKLQAQYSLVAGVPARVVKPLDEDARVLVEFPTRPE